MRDDEISGVGAYNITTRVATCRRVGRFVRRYLNDYPDWCGNIATC